MSVTFIHLLSIVHEPLQYDTTYAHHTERPPPACIHLMAVSIGTRTVASLWRRSVPRRLLTHYTPRIQCLQVHKDFKVIQEVYSSQLTELPRVYFTFMAKFKALSPKRRFISSRSDQHSNVKEKEGPLGV